MQYTYLVLKSGIYMGAGVVVLYYPLVHTLLTKDSVIDKG